MTTPIKQRATFQSNSNTPYGSIKKTKPAASTNHSNVENMTPSRMNRICIPKPHDTIEQNGGDGEGIQVAIRMRPLNSKEHTHKKVWKVLSKYASVAQTTIEGKPLPERIAGRNFFTYDQTFDESSTTYQVYCAIAQPIVTTACTGRNGTIFAYGQTSSGKTYTMQGSGSIAEGFSDNIQDGNGGIVHMAAHDIFAHIASCPDRAFVVRASFLEIYNEEVRDLLQDYSNSNKVLQIREDPRRGVFVQSKELIATDAGSLLAVLWQGEKSRSFASTAMNERSSRSHTLFRVTIESRSSVDDNDDDDNEETSGAVRVSTLNLVDLAGSESVRHTGATGDRQKEGGMINQSLLTLSRVIVALGTPNSSHVNFRDSKLTRILQPSLSGNARMAVVCCATPSELYLEETRSTLLFASRAKLVKTNAQINEVEDDRSIIRRLQRELALARSQQSGGGNHISANVATWENLAATSGSDAKLAKDKLKRLYTTILMRSELDDTNVSLLLGVDEKISSKKSVEFGQDVEQPPTKRHRRRMSDGNLQQFISSNIVNTPLQVREQSNPSTDHPHGKKTIAGIQVINTLSSFDELLIMRQVVAAKERKSNGVKRQMDLVLKQLQGKDLELVSANCSNDLLRSDRDEVSSVCGKMSNEINKLKSELLAAKSEHDLLMVANDSEILMLRSQLKQELDDRRVLEETVDTSHNSKLSLERMLTFQLTEKDATITALREELEACRVQLNHQADVVNFELRQHSTEMESEKLSLIENLESTAKSLCMAEATVLVVSNTNNELESKCNLQLKQIIDITDKYNNATRDLHSSKEYLHEANLDIERQSMVIASLEGIQKNLATDSQNLKSQMNELMMERAAATEEIFRMTNQQKAMNDTLDEVKNNYDAVVLEVTRLTDMLRVTEIKLNGLLVVLKKNEVEVEILSLRLSSEKAVNQDTDTKLLQQQTVILDLESQLLMTTVESHEVQLHSSTITKALDEAVDQCNGLSIALKKTGEEKSMVLNENSKLTEANAKLERSLVDLKCNFDTELLVLQNALHDAKEAESIMKHKYAKSALDVSNKFDVLTIMIHRSELDKKILTDECIRLNEMNTANSLTIECLNGKIASDEKLLNDRMEEIIRESCESAKLMDEKERGFRDAEIKIEGLLVVLRQFQIQLDLAISDREMLRTELAIAMCSLQKSSEEIGQLTQRIGTLTSEVSNHVITIRSITIEHETSVLVANELRAEMVKLSEVDEGQKDVATRLHQDVKELDSKCKLFERAMDASQQLASQMLGSLTWIENEHSSFLPPYEVIEENENESAESSSCGHIVPSLKMIQLRLYYLSNVISLFKTKFSEQSKAYSASEEELHQARIRVAEANDSIRSLNDKVQHLEQTLLSKEIDNTRNDEIFDEERKRLTSDLNQATLEVDVLKTTVAEVNAEVQRHQLTIEFNHMNVDSVQCENKELKMLLANANNSIEEARMSNIEMAKQLAEKFVALENMRNLLQAKDSEISLLGKKNEPSVDQTFPDVINLIEEKERVKRLLKEEIDYRDKFEMDLKRRMSDEQRILIHEAEQAMHGLRGDLESKTNALKRAETEAYAAREMKDDLEDQCRRIQDRAIQLECQIVELKNESSKLRRLSSRQETEHESEVSALKESLSFAKTERQENHSLIRDLKQKVATLEGELESFTQDLLKNREQLVTKSSHNFEQRNIQLSLEVQQLHKEAELLQRVSKENTSSHDKLMALENENDRLRQKLKSYVDRCEKLESSKLTKDKLEAIKRLMADKVAVEKELENAKQEIALMKSTLSVNGAHLCNSLEDAELTRLRFDRTAMENKLRKFASQCQHLEDEKMRIIQAFTSTKVELFDDDIEKAIVALCDKVASLEEECDSLANWKNTSLSQKVEISTMQKQSKELSSKVNELQINIDNLQRIETANKNLNAKLQHDVDLSRQEADTMRNQLKYLEQENLQLMIDYKAAKQKIHRLKAEFNLLQSQKPMTTVNSSMDSTRVSAKKAPKTPNDKENLQGSNKSEKKKNPPTGSSSISARSINKDRRNQPVTSRLGDAFAASDENTQECKQS